MLNGRRTLRVCFLALALGVMGAVPLLGGSAVVGSVAGSMNATIGGQALLPNTTIFSRSEEHTSELQSLAYLVCRLLLEKKKKLLVTIQNTLHATANYLR